MDEVIKTKRGLYGRVNITIPLPVKMSLFELQKNSGLKKAEFLRMALVTGYIALSGGIKKIELTSLKEENFSQQSART